MKHKIAAALAPLITKVRTDARGVKHRGGRPYKQDEPLDLGALTHHANGGPAYGCYPIKPGETVCMAACLDFDSHKGESNWQDMADAALTVANECDKRGLVPHPWRSGGGHGIHLLFVWAGAQDARSVRRVLADVLKAAGYKDGAAGVKASEVEVFPKQDRVAFGAYGNYFFLPAAFESVPLDEFTFEPRAKESIVGYVWRNSSDVPIAPAEENLHYVSNVDADFDEVASALAAIPNGGVGYDYETWFRIIAGVHSADSGEGGKEIAEAWSEQSDKHERTWFEHTWAHLKSDRDGGAGVGTIFHHARLNGWDRYGPAVEAALNAIDIESAAARIGNATPVATKLSAMATLPLFQTNRFGIATPCISNVKLALENALTVGGARFGYDTFKDELVIAEWPGEWRAITDVDLIRLRLRFESMQGGIPGIGREIMRDAVQEVADAHKFDSGIAWLSVLKWDGVSRIERFLTTYFGAADSPYVCAVSFYLWTALAGRVMVPGVQADMVPIFVGLQGIGKSTGLQCLVPARELFAEISLTQKDDDLARILRGRLVVELGELKGLNSREIEHTKSFFTRRHEAWIPKYQEFSTSYPRRCVFFGTTNADEFLEDSTGNRRFLPVRVGLVDRAALERDCLQLWAEARELFEIDLTLGGDGVMWQSAEKLARAVHDEFTVEDPWTDDVARWLEEREDSDAPFTAVDAIKGSLVVSVGTLHQGHKKRIAAILRRLGYADGRPYVGGRQMRAWVKTRQ